MGRGVLLNFRETLNTADHCNLCVRSRTHGVSSMRRVTDVVSVISKKQSTHTVKCEQNVDKQ
jgi:hypothetical protein